MKDQNEYKDKIVNFYKRHKRMPGYKEIMSLVDFKSKNAVYKLINKLVDEGVVNKDSEGRITPSKGLSEVPLLGMVEAGVPTEAGEIHFDTLNIDEYLVEDNANSFFLEVKGDSMIDEGIREGDLVLAKSAKVARDGEIVIAEVDGEWTMKYFKKNGDKVWLEPANVNFKPIYPKCSLRIAAVVKGVIRKY